MPSTSSTSFFDSYLTTKPMGYSASPSESLNLPGGGKVDFSLIEKPTPATTAATAPLENEEELTYTNLSPLALGNTSLASVDKDFLELCCKTPTPAKTNKKAASLQKRVSEPLTKRAKRWRTSIRQKSVVSSDSSDNDEVPIDQNQRGKGYCNVESCGVSWGSQKDIDMQKKRKNIAIGCDFKSPAGVKCEFWAHASCVKFTVPKKEKGRLPKFFCEKHRT